MISESGMGTMSLGTTAGRRSRGVHGKKRDYTDTAPPVLSTGRRSIIFLDLAFGLHMVVSQFACRMAAHHVCDQRGIRVFVLLGGAMGLTICISGTLNGSSPTANLAGANIKGVWMVSILRPAPKLAGFALGSGWK